jgi:signal transduction histidine kinase
MPFHSIDDSLKLARVIEATMLLQADIDLPVLLGHVIDEARSLTGARYGALGIFNREGSALEEFLTVGLTEAEEARIGPRPRGGGILGLNLTDPRPLRLPHLGMHPESSGFPPHHPPMESILVVPVEVRNAVYGSLYLTDKIDAFEFTSEDEALVEALAVAAGMAIANTRLQKRVRELAIIDDRDRTARDLHDNVVQHLYAVGISLESMMQEAETPEQADRLAVLVSDVGESIRQIRSSIYELGPDEENPGVRRTVLNLVRSLSPVLGFNARVTFDGPVDSVISQSVTEQLLATIREAVTNIGRHAHGTQGTVSSQGCRQRHWTRRLSKGRDRSRVSEPATQGAGIPRDNGDSHLRDGWDRTRLERPVQSVARPHLVLGRCHDGGHDHSAGRQEANPASTAITRVRDVETMS